MESIDGAENVSSSTCGPLCKGVPAKGEHTDRSARGSTSAKRG
jgi:hypothetical protein